MHDPQQEFTPPRRSRATLSLVVIVCTCALLTILFLVWNLPPRLRSQQVVSQPGTYRFPTGNNSIQVAKDQSGNLTITVHRQGMRFYFFPFTYSEPPITFESEREWFLTVDRYQRLWVYHGHWDRIWGELRQMPSGGTIPYAPAVLLHGSFCLKNGALVSGSSVVTETGDWAGVPAEFLARIRKSGNVKWGKVPAIPDSPPPLTRLQESQLSSRPRRAS
jgi:hypothetical protein